MTAKMKVKVIIDMEMIMLLPVLMAYLLVGEVVHEWVGVSMFVLFLIHHALNIQWHRNLPKGNYSSVRFVNTGTNILLFLCMLLLMASGMILSRHVFAFLQIRQGMSWAREVHLCVSYWSFLLMSLHIGFHGQMILAMVTRKRKENSLKKEWLIRIIALILVCFGGYAFVKRQFISYLFLQTHFAFYDYSEPIIFFFFDYACVMIMVTICGYYVMEFLKWAGRYRNKKICVLIKLNKKE